MYNHIPAGERVAQGDPGSAAPCLGEDRDLSRCVCMYRSI